MKWVPLQETKVQMILSFWMWMVTNPQENMQYKGVGCISLDFIFKLDVAMFEQHIYMCMEYNASDNIKLTLTRKHEMTK